MGALELMAVSGARRRMDRGADALVGAATADIGDRGVDLGVGRFRAAREQGRHRHDHAALAIAALRDVVVEPGLLHLVQVAVRGEAFDGGDRAVADRAQRQRAGACRHAVDMHGAGAALGDSAAVSCAHQADDVSQHPKQWRVGIDVDLVRSSVDGKTRHQPPRVGPAPGPRSHNDLKSNARSFQINNAGTDRSPQAAVGSMRKAGLDQCATQERAAATGVPVAAGRPKGDGGQGPPSDAYAIAILWFFRGNERMRLPVALKYALSTAGAATQIVGSPMPPQGSLPPARPDCRTIDSTFGISAMRIEL